MSRNKEIRKALYKKQGGRCVYCDKKCFLFNFSRHESLPNHSKAATLDHIKPKAQINDNSCQNLVMACLKCNRKKGEVLLEKFLTDNFSKKDVKKITARIDEITRPVLIKFPISIEYDGNNKDIKRFLKTHKKELGIYDVFGKIFLELI